MNDLRLSARLHDLDEVLTSPGEIPSAESAIALHHRRRRTRAGVIATVAAVVAIAAGVPTAIGSLSSGEVAVPSTSIERSTSAPRPTTAVAPTTAASTAPPTATSAPDPGNEAELAEVAAALPPVSLTSPALWDQWLPEGKPYPGMNLEEDLSTCPVLSARLETVVGQEMSYWTGTLPNGPGGCTWVEIPLSAESNDYDYVINVGFMADGTTVEPFRRYREGPGQGTHPCPSMDVPAVAEGSLLVRCASSAGTGYTLVVPDRRLDDGLWVVSVQSKDSTPVRPAEILPVLVDGVVAAFG